MARINLPMYYIVYTNKVKPKQIFINLKLFVCEITQRIKHFTNDQKH